MAKLEDIPITRLPRGPKNNLCIDCGNPIAKSAKLRCRECWIKAKQGRPYGSRTEPCAPAEQDVVLWHEQDSRFCLAMIRATEAGLERPPGMRISKIPCTHNPVFVQAPRDIPIRSACAWMDSMPGGE